MNKITVVLYKDYASIKNEKYDKETVFNSVRQQRHSAKVRNISVQNKEDWNIYTILCDNNIIKVVFPKMFEKENKEYESILQTWYKYTRKRNILYSKLCALGLVGVIAGVKLAPYAESVIDKASDVIEESLDNTKFYLTNMGEICDIKELEREIKAHTGYGEIDGYKQSIEDHNNSYCALGDDLNSNEVVAAIYEYCNENGLGNTVANAAGDKFVLLQQDNTTAAYEIDLLDIYRDEKIKTLK